MLSMPPITNATIILQSSSMAHESYQEQYAKEKYFKDIYATLIQVKHVEEINYYVQDKLLYHLGKLCIP